MFVGLSGYPGSFPNFESGKGECSEKAAEVALPLHGPQSMNEPVVRGGRLNSLDASDESSDGEIAESDAEEFTGVFGVQSRSPLVCFQNTFELSKKYEISDESKFFYVEIRCPQCFDINALPAQLVKEAVEEGKQIQIERGGRVFKLNFHEGYGLTKSQVIASLAGPILNLTIDYRDDIESIDVESLSANSIDIGSMEKYTYLPNKSVKAV